MEKQQYYKQTFAKNREQKRVEDNNLRRRERTQQRHQQYQKSRNFLPENPEKEANEKPLQTNPPTVEKHNEVNRKKDSNILVNTKNDHLSKKQTEYLQRFIEWKKNKKNTKVNEKNGKENIPVKKPFIPAGIASRNHLATHLPSNREYTGIKPKLAESNRCHEPEVYYFIISGYLVV